MLEHSSAETPGRITFVGTGCGDPRLLTIAAVQAIGEADVIMSDAPQLLAVLDDEAVRVNHGTRIQLMSGSPPPVGELIRGLTVEMLDAVDAEQRLEHILAAAEGNRHVVRLAAGDPFLDGRIASEAADCSATGLQIEVVPGVSSMTALPEFAGVSLAHRPTQLLDVADDIDASQLSHTGTLVVRLTQDQLPSLVRAAVAAGRSETEPALVVVDGGTPSQRSVRVMLADLEQATRELTGEPNSRLLVVSGAGVAEPETSLDWFAGKPLFGWRVLVPRTKEQAASLNRRLNLYGATAEEVPTIVVEPPRTPQQMDRAVRGLVEGEYGWVVFTSANTVRAIREKFTECGLDARAMSGLRIACVGNVTGNVLREWGLQPDLIPSGEQSAAGLAAEFPAYDEVLDPINRVFLPRADIATEALVDGLVDLGWEVDAVTAYRTVRASPPPQQVREDIKRGAYDAVVFTSSSTVRNLVGIAGKPHKTTVVAAIGPKTAQTCAEHGLEVVAIPETPGAVELVDALARFASQRKRNLIESGKPVIRPSQRKRRGRLPKSSTTS